MGMDIVCHVEIKVNGKWLHYSQPRIPRDYALFSRLGARNDDLPRLVESRGIPEDATESTMFCYRHDEEDAHHDTWLTSDEWSQIIDEFFDFGTYRKRKPTGNCYEMDFFGFLFGNGWHTKYKDDWEHGVEDYRVIFWFDG